MGQTRDELRPPSKTRQSEKAPPRLKTPGRVPFSGGKKLTLAGVAEDVARLRRDLEDSVAKASRGRNNRFVVFDRNGDLSPAENVRLADKKRKVVISNKDQIPAGFSTDAFENARRLAVFFAAPDGDEVYLTGIFILDQPNSTAVARLDALVGYISTSHGSGTVGIATGLKGVCENTGAGTLIDGVAVHGEMGVSAGTITTGKIFSAEAFDTGGSIGTLYGYYAGDISDGTSANWGFYSLSADCAFKGKVAIGTETLAAQAHVDQPSTSAAIPVLALDQGDIDDAFINFIGASAADGSRSISTDTTEDSAKFGAVLVEVGGVKKWMRLYDDES